MTGLFRLGRRSGIGLTLLLLIALAPFGQEARADHESTNQLTFSPVADAFATAGGTGTIEYHGGAEPESRWTSTFAFIGLAPNADFDVVVKGRFGIDGSAEAAAFTTICSFAAASDGTGGCWDYGLGMRRVGEVQLRQTDSAATVVLQATRAPAGPGDITSRPNFFSPDPNSAPVTPTSGTPAATPVSEAIATPS